MDFRGATKEVDNSVPHSEIMSKIKEEVMDDESLVTSDNFNVTIKEEVDDDAVIDMPTPMELISYDGYGSDPHSHEISDTYDEYEIVIKAEPELEISDELQSEITDELHSMQKCEHCDFLTNRKYYLDIHNEMMHSGDTYSDPDELSCPHCDYKANNKLNVKRHLVANHLGGERRYSCYICDFKTQNLLSLQSHRACHRNAKLYSCPHCTTFKCTQLDTMREHERKHLVEMSCHKLLFCEHCDYRTFFKYSLKMHSKVHLSEKPQERVPIHSCKLCDFRTKRLRVLKVHHRRIHLGEEPFRCPECKQAYSTNGSLMRHLKTHSKEEHSIQCTECDYKTLQYSSMKGHMKTHSKHPQTYTCIHCDYSTPPATAGSRLYVIRSKENPLQEIYAHVYSVTSKSSSFDCL